MTDALWRAAAASRRDLLALVLAAPGLVARAAVPGVTATEIVIGQSITLQNGRNDHGVAVMDGIHAVFDQAQAGGGMHGRRILLHTLDDDNSAAKAEANARRLMAESNPFLLFAPIEGGPSTAVMKAAIDLGVPLFGPMAGSPGLRRPHQPLVFPVRAEHRDEFRALLKYGQERGLKRAAFLHSDSDVGLAHLANVQLAARELEIEVVAAMPIGSEVSDAALQAMVARLSQRQAQLMFNHGSIGTYERLIRGARQARLPTQFMAVNSGSTQLAARLGDLAVGMVFTQDVPNPLSRGTQLARDYQASFRKAWPDKAFSYGSLEGWLTAGALLLALAAAGPALTRARFVSALYEQRLSVSGFSLRYAPGDHRGSAFVDLAMFTREQRFLH